ncbi:hypothetical protein HHI36_017360 [Cryptolaemus montrouzieri]|uniref:Uncharacterized protein n=1 Tax=Cryptolaemus montrouzieri TaxID=559131 RepID=A0ABD2NMP4_9CUCU
MRANLGDHLAMLVEVKIVNTPNNSASPSVDKKLHRNFSKNNLNMLESYMHNLSFDDVYFENTDVDSTFSTFMSILNFAIDVNCPLKLSGTNKTNSENKRWLTSEIELESRKLKDLYCLAKTSQSKNLYDNYKSQKKEQDCLIKRTKRKFYGELISNEDNKPKKTGI